MSSMRLSRRKFLAGVGAGATLGGFAPSIALAQDPVSAVDILKIYVGAPPGSTTDILGRRFGETLRPAYAQTVLVDNRVGASGQLAVVATKSAAKDGGNLLLAASAPFAIFPLTYKTLPYSADTDLVPVSTLAEFIAALAVGPMVPSSVKTAPEFFAWCKANPEKASFGSPAAGSPLHFLGTMAGKSVGANFQHVPYRGGVAAAQDVIGGQIAAVVSILGDFQPFITNEKFRILATSGPSRTKFTPNVATFEEQGIKGFTWVDWYGLFMPAGTPPVLVEKLNRQIRAIATDKAALPIFEERFMEPKWSTSAELAARIQSDRKRWAPIVKSLNFSVDT